LGGEGCREARKMEPEAMGPGVGEPEQWVARDVTGGKAFREISAPEVPQDCLARADLQCPRRAIDPPRVAFEVPCEGECLEQCPAADGSLAAIDDMVDQRNCRNDLAELGKVPLQCRRELAASQPSLQFFAPCPEFSRC